MTTAIINKAFSEFSFEDGKLIPLLILELHADGPDIIEDLLDQQGYRLSWNSVDNLVSFYRKERDSFEKTWILIIGDWCDSAFIKIEGWENYFTALRYFQPIIQLLQSVD